MDDVTGQERYLRGWERLGELDSKIGDTIVASLRDVAPDLGRYAVEFAFGDVYSRPELSLAEREIATIAALTALGNAPGQLKVHLRAGLKAGLSRAQIGEILIQMAVYAGFPAALNAAAVASEVFRESSDPTHPAVDQSGSAAGNG